MGKMCETCPLRGKQYDRTLATWVWFDMLVEQGTFLVPDPESIEDQQYFFEGACRQADIEVPEKERAEALLAVQAMMTCFRAKAEQDCPLE